MTKANGVPGYEVHPLAKLFPPLPPDEYKKLKTDIWIHGQHEPIMLSADGKTVLDGVNRLRACKELGIEPRIERFDGRLSEADYIWGKNVLRRHLTDDQRAALAHKWSDAERDAAKERQRQHGGTAPGKPKNTLDRLARSVPRTRKAIAQKAKVSERKVRQVEKLAKHAPELLPKVESGEVKLKDAVKSAETPKLRGIFVDGGFCPENSSAFAPKFASLWEKQIRTVTDTLPPGTLRSVVAELRAVLDRIEGAQSPGAGLNNNDAPSATVEGVGVT